MLSHFTQTAIAVLKDISEDSANRVVQLSSDSETFSVLFSEIYLTYNNPETST